LRDWTLLREAKRDVDAGGGLVEQGGKLLDGLGFLKGLAFGGLGVIPGLAVSAGAGAARKVAQNFVQERGTAWLARVADSIAKGNRRMSNAVEALSGSPPKLATSRAAQFEIGSLGEVASMPAPQSPSGVVARQAAQTGNYAERFQKLREQVTTFRSDPQKTTSLLQDLTGDLAQAHPEVAASVQRQFMGDLDYLANTLPASVTTSVNPLRGKPLVPPYEQRRAVAIADALNDPDGVLESLATGRYDQDQWAALRERRPLRYEEIKMQVLQSYSMNADAMTFQRRNLIGTAFQFPADWSQVPENAMALQSIGGGQPAPEQAPQGRGPSLDPGISDQLTTPAQTALGA
jgi:hypothetical protein